MHEVKTMLYRNLAVMIFAAILFVSCSGSGGNSITAPTAVPDQPVAQADADRSSHQLWGYYTITIHPETLTAEVTPLRGAQFTCNVTQFMQPPSSPLHMITFDVLPGSTPETGYFEVSVTLRHPFPGIPLYRGFDVRGVLIGNGSNQSEYNTNVLYGGDEDTVLVNADGYTRWWNPTEFTSYGSIFGYTTGGLAPPVFPTAIINGYKYFADELGYDQEVSEMNPDSRGNFATSPGVYSRPYFIQFPMDGSSVVFEFNYAIDASWADPDPAGEPNYDVEFYPPEANCQEPYCIKVTNDGSTAYYVDGTDNGGTLELQVEVFDWQAVDDPLGVPGQVDSIWIEGPLFNNPINLLDTAVISDSGPTSSVYEVSISQLNLTKSGDEMILVYAETTDGIGYEPQVPGGNAFNFPLDPLGAYLVGTVEILAQNPGGDPPIVLSIDPDTAMSGDVLIDVEVGGLNFQPGASVELRLDTWTPIEATNEVVSGGGTLITCDLDLAIASQGDWDVVVINPDLQEGSLPGGFHVDCAEDIHSFDSKYSLTGGLYWNYCQRGDLAILETGTHAGQCILKRSYDSGGTYPGNYVRFDPDNASNTNATDFFSLPGTSDGQVAYVTMTAQIDQNPVNGHIGVVNGRMFDTVQIVDENGLFVEDVNIPPGTDTYANRYPVIPGVDFDDDGDLWLVVDMRGEWYPHPQAPSKLDPIWELRHYELQASSPYYAENTSDRLDISMDLYDLNAAPWSAMWYVADIAISYVEDSLFILSSNIQGSNHSLFNKYDLATTPPTLEDTQDLIPQITICSNPFSGSSRVDIEFDHSDLSTETCRLVVMYQTWSGQVDTHMMRLDTDLNILSDDIMLVGSGSWNVPQAIAINTDPVLRNIIAIDMESTFGTYNDFFYFDMPATGW